MSRDMLFLLAAEIAHAIKVSDAVEGGGVAIVDTQNSYASGPAAARFLDAPILMAAMRRYLPQAAFPVLITFDGGSRPISFAGIPSEADPEKLRGTLRNISWIDAMRDSFPQDEISSYAVNAANRGSASTRLATIWAASKEEAVLKLISLFDPHLCDHPEALQDPDLLAQRQLTMHTAHDWKKCDISGSLGMIRNALSRDIDHGDQEGPCDHR